jgi:hypothetical protein
MWIRSSTVYVGLVAIGLSLFAWACIRSGMEPTPSPADSREDHSFTFRDLSSQDHLVAPLKDLLDLGSQDQIDQPRSDILDAWMHHHHDAPSLDLQDMAFFDIHEAAPPDQGPPADAQLTRLTISPDDDATVRQGQPDQSFGDEIELAVGYCGDPMNNNMRIWLKFDLGAVPPGATVVSARIFLFYFIHWGSQDYQLRFSSVDSWSEHTITWNNQPSANKTPSSYLEAFYVDDEWQRFEVESLVRQELLGDTVLSVVLQGETLYDPITSPPDMENYARSKEYYSKGTRPYLEIIYK